MRRLIVGLASAAVLVLLGLWTLAFFFQEKLIWFPGGPPRESPASYGLSFEELTLRPEPGVVLHAWLLVPGAPDAETAGARGVVHYSHGNAGNIAVRLGAAQALLAHGWAVLLYDYRGYGKSTGTPSEAGTYADALAAYEALIERGYAPERIVLFGESLGGGPALELARVRPVGGVILESAFTSIVDVGRHHYPFLPVRLLARVHYDNVAKLPELRAPLLVVHSPADRIVPFEHGRRLFEAAREPRYLLETEADHNDGGWLRRPEYRARVGEFLRFVEGRAADGGSEPPR